VSVSAKHPVGVAALEVARSGGWTVKNVSEALVAIQLGHPGYTPRDVETQFNLGPYRLDFAIPVERIAIEADGWVHGAQSVRKRDGERDRTVRGWGWAVVRIDTEEGDVGTQLRRHLPNSRGIAAYGEALRRMDCQVQAHLDKLQRRGITDPQTALDLLSDAFRVARENVLPGKPRVGA